MPYMQEGKCVYKKNPDGSKGKSMGCSESEEMAKKHMSALYAAENKSYAEFSMVITKASIPDKKNRTMHLQLVNSDVDEDAYGEKMSVELFNDFVQRIENDEPVPEPFADVVCEEEWCGGLPYLSISHFKSGAGKNVPGEVESVYVDGERLKSKAVLYDTVLGRAVWKSICDDIECRNKPVEEKKFKNPVRVSIGFVDLEHKHVIEGEDDYVFTRTMLGQKCPKCEDGINGKVYLKGQLVHKAFTRVPANPRTSVEVFRMSDEIKTREDDAKSIIGDEAENLVGKSMTEDVLVVKADEPEKEEESRDQKKKKEEVEKEEKSTVPDKPEVVMEPEVTIIEPVVKAKHGMEDCAEDDEECKKKMAKKEKSKVEATVDTLLETLSLVKAKSAPKTQLQPVLDALVKSINEETADPQDAMLEQMRSMFKEELAAMKPELVAEVLRAIPTAPASFVAQETPQPRSLLINRNAPQQPQRQLTEIEKIALRSTGAQV